MDPYLSNDTEQDASNNYSQFTDINSLTLSKNLLMQNADQKFTLFAACLEEVGLSHSYPYLDISRNALMKYLSTRFNIRIPSIYPVDYSEEVLMRNCVKRRMMAMNLTKEYMSI